MHIYSKNNDLRFILSTIGTTIVFIIFKCFGVDDALNNIWLYLIVVPYNTGVYLLPFGKKRILSITKNGISSKNIIISTKDLKSIKFEFNDIGTDDSRNFILETKKGLIYSFNFDDFKIDKYYFIWQTRFVLEIKL